MNTNRMFWSFDILKDVSHFLTVKHFNPKCRLSAGEQASHEFLNAYILKLYVNLD